MLSKLLSFIFRRNAALISTVIDKSLKIFFIQLGGMVLLFAANWLMVKYSSEHIYGIYSIVINWLIIAGAIAQMGMDDYHVANLPVLKEKNETGAVRKIFYWSTGIVSLSSILVMLIVFVIINYVPINAVVPFRSYINVGIFLILLQALLGNFVAYLRGIGHIVYGQIADKLVRPLLFLVMLFILFRNLDFDRIILSQVTSLAACIILTFFIAKSFLNKEHAAISFDSSLRSNFYFLGITLLQLLATRLDILVLSIFEIPAEAGHYNIAMRLADLAAFPLVIINLVIPGFLAHHNYRSEKKELYSFMQSSSRAAFLGVSLLLILLFFIGIPLLGFFGKNFEGTFPVLIILGCSHLVSTFKSPVNGLFVVAGRERTALWCLAANVAITALACFILVPRYSVTGAALAILSGNLFHTILLLVIFYRAEKILITPFSFLYPKAV